MKNCYINFLLIFIILSDSNIMVSGIGGHDLFASLAQLEIVWENEKGTISVMERIAKKWKDLPGHFHE